MELADANRIIKNTGLDKSYITHLTDVRLSSLAELGDFVKRIYESGIQAIGCLYEMNIFILHNNGTVTIIFNHDNDVCVSPKNDLELTEEFAEIIQGQDRIILYETELTKFAAV